MQLVNQQCFQCERGIPWNPSGTATADTRDGDELRSEIFSTISSSELCDTSISPYVVVECLSRLGMTSLMALFFLLTTSFLPLLHSLLILQLFSLLSFVMVTCLPHCETVHLYQYPSLARIPLTPKTTAVLP